MAASRADSPTKRCTEPGCGRPLRARGLCSTHYNRAHRPGNHDRRPTSCVVCGQVVERFTDRCRSPCCSPECRTLLQHGAATVESYDWALAAIKRARKAGCQVIDRVERDAVLMRDGYACYLCGIDTSIATSPFDPGSATVDHVVPLSKGGEHTMANVRCACLGCNSSKRDQEPVHISPAA
jgi:5-methylcytosine-specific restriction endonuclease McrA